MGKTRTAINCIKKRHIVPGILLASLSLVSCTSSSPGADSSTASSNNRVADLQIVDCLLPGQMRRLGNSSYLTPRRPTRTTAADCRIRGGEYVDYDRADYKTALNVWMAAAEQGDAEAQVNVGEIFEKGAGGAPNYQAAVIWYERAAEQGSTRAQFNLGTLYEQGLGVEKDPLIALNLYRQAWGLPEDDVIYQSAAYREQKDMRQQLEGMLSEKVSQISLLQNQIQQLQVDVKVGEEAAKVEQELVQLRDWVAKLEQEKSVTLSRVSDLPVFREPQAEGGSTATVEQPSSDNATDNVQFGKYYALIIGNQDYQNMEKLYSPRHDAEQVAQVLRDKYGFSVQLLLDASSVEVMQAINDLNEVIGVDDNLLVYYAGHGSRLQTGEQESGYWLPVNAEPPPRDTFWVSNEFVTRHLARLKAKRVLVVADSCYAGLLSNAPGYLFVGDEKPYDENYLRYKLDKRARLVLSSGGDQPVLDNSGQGHSVFARAFLDVLQSNQKIIAGPDLYIKVRDRVVEGAKKVGFQQEPAFKAMKGAGHEVGDFFFVPTKKS